MGSCNKTSQNQQWMWTENEKLLHIKSTLCLGISSSSRGPSRAAIFTQCSQAPRWTCYEEGGFLEVENASLFLKKQGFRAMVKKGRKYLHSWMKIDVNEKGNLVNESLCLKKVSLSNLISVRTGKYSNVSNMAKPVQVAAGSVSPSHSSHDLQTIFPPPLRCLPPTLPSHHPISSPQSLYNRGKLEHSKLETGSNNIKANSSDISTYVYTYTTLLLKYKIIFTTVYIARSTTEIYSQSSNKRQSPSMQTTGITESPWVQTTTQMFSSTTEETGLVEPVRCNISLTESRVSSRSVFLRWRTLGSPCNFSLTCSNDTESRNPVQINTTTYEWNSKDLQAGTTYNFTIMSQDGEERTVVLQTDPLPPARFEVNKEKTTSTSLHVWWTPSPGKVTCYEMQLFDDNKQKIQGVQIQESTSWTEYTFFNLTAGNKYNISITAVSGDKRSSTIYTSGSTVPSPVKDIGISTKTNSLLISWSHGSGNVERYQLMLMDKGSLVHNRVMDKHATSYTFHSLTPGHLYNLTIVTEATGLQNYRSKLVRTTPMEVSNLKVTNDGSLTSLKVKWQRPLGDVDSYNITLSHQGTISKSEILAPQVTETHFGDLTPGRLYQVTVSCVSGELSAQKMAVGRTVPEKVGNLKANSNSWTRSLVVSWSPPAGDWEQYRIMLFNGSLVLLNITVGKEETHYVMDDVGLIPGRQYDVEVIVESGNQKNSERCQGRTGKQISKC
uniref:Protein tyrosine phosphatase receptor type B n=1 Tax=Loxodonta africana TaxID=9785 RepID=G3UHL8_LOXAF